MKARLEESSITVVYSMDSIHILDTALSKFNFNVRVSSPVNGKSTILTPRVALRINMLV
jgi:hypothetical protein